MAREPWTKEQIRRLKKLYPHFLEGKLSMEELMGILNKPKHGIRSKALQLGISQRKPKMDDELYNRVVKRLKI